MILLPMHTATQVMSMMTATRRPAAVLLSHCYSLPGLTVLPSYHLTQVLQYLLMYTTCTEYWFVSDLHLYSCCVTWHILEICTVVGQSIAAGIFPHLPCSKNTDIAYVQYVLYCTRTNVRGTVLYSTNFLRNQSFTVSLYHCCSCDEKIPTKGFRKKSFGEIWDPTLDRYAFSFQTRLVICKADLIAVCCLLVKWYYITHKLHVLLWTTLLYATMDYYIYLTMYYWYRV